MRTHYTGPTSAFYRCQESLSRLWWEAYQNLETLRFQAVEAFTERHQDLLGEDGYLWESIIWGPTIVAPTRPAGCRPHTHKVDPPMGGWAWLPDQRTRTGRMLTAQLDGLPKFDPQMIMAAAPMPGNMPWNHQDETGTMLHFREVIDGVLHICWPVPIPDLDPAVWSPIDADEYAQAVAERKHRERVHGLKVIHYRLTHHGIGDPDALSELAAAVAAVLAQHREDHARVEATRDLVLRAEHLLAERHHLGQPGEEQVRIHVDAALITASGQG